MKMLLNDEPKGILVLPDMQNVIDKIDRLECRITVVEKQVNQLIEARR